MPTKSEEIHGMIAISIFSLISNIAVTLVLYKVTRDLIRGEERPIIKLLVGNLLASDWLQSIGFVISTVWAIKGELVQSSWLCGVQGFLIQVGDVSSGCWATVICIHTFLMTFCLDRPDALKPVEKYYVKICMALVWPFNLCMAFSGFFIDKSFYASAGGSWCWISINYQNFRMGYHYGIIIVLAGIMVCLYMASSIKLWRRAERASTHITKLSLYKVREKIVYYPVVYILLVFPLTLYRVLLLTGKQLPFQYLIAAGCIFTSAGFVNSIIYGTTRSILVFPSTSRIKSEIFRRSGASRVDSVDGSRNGFISVQIDVSEVSNVSSVSGVPGVPDYPTVTPNRYS